MIGRRVLLQAAGSGAALAVADTRPSRAASTQVHDEKRRALYAESEHVKTFYQVNRYPKLRRD